MAFRQKRIPTRYNHHTIPLKKVLQAQTKSCLAKSENQDEDPCPNLPKFIIFLTSHDFLSFGCYNKKLSLPNHHQLCIKKTTTTGSPI